MQTNVLLRKIALFFAFSLFMAALCVPDQRYGGLSPLQAEDDEEMEYEDDDGGSDFDGEDLDEMTPRERRQYIREETEGMRLGEKLEFLNEFNQALQEQRTESVREEQFEREEERLERLYDRGLISDDEYERRVDQAADRLGIEDPEYSTGGYEEGWEHRNEYFQGNSANMDAEQKALNIDYVKHGDRPLESDEGITPKPNPLLEAPVAYDSVSSARLSSAILEGLKDDVVGLGNSLPEGCRIEDAQALIKQKREAGEQPAIVEQVQAALIDRDVRRFERNAEALGIPKQQIQSLLVGITFKSLQDHLEDGASVDEIRKITEPMVRRVDQAGLDAELAGGLANWLKSIPDLMKIQTQLASGSSATASWPSGEVPVIFDPKLSGADARILQGGTLVASAEGEARITVGLGNKYTASGIPVLKGSPANIPVQGAKAETPSLLLSYPGDGGDPVSYTITCYLDVPTQTPNQFQPREAWKQDYSIKPGLKQSLPLAWTGRVWYLISCPTKDGTGQPKQYSLKPESGVSPSYAFQINGNTVTVVSSLEKVVLDNSKNSRPFLYMEGDHYATIRAGVKKDFDSGVTIRYARNAKTAPPKDANGQPIAGAAAVATDISTITLRNGESGTIGVNSNGDWEIRKEGELLLAEKNEVKLPVIKLAKNNTESSLTTQKTEEGSSARGTLYVLAVGISKYQNPKQFPSLAFADKDVTAIADILKRQENTVFKSVAAPKILLNDKATAISIRTELKGLEKKVTKNDTVALIFSGHGMLEKNEYYFCPYNTEATKLARQGISCEELQKVTDELSARNVFVFLDSCYSGGATDKIQKTFENKVGKVGNSGVVIFASSKGSESSQEDPSWGHGALTKAFLDTVANPELDRNNDSLIQVVELDAGLTEGVKQLTGGGQHVQSAEFGASILNLPVARFNSN